MIRYDTKRYDMIYFVNYNWVDTRWQQYSKHLHTNNTQNNTINNRITQLNLLDFVCCLTETIAPKDKVIFSGIGKDLKKKS